MRVTKRVFIAVDISEKVREKLSEFIGELRKDFAEIRVGWEKPEKVHLTLKFLGEIDDEQLSRVKEAVRETAAGSEPFRLTVENTGCFPSPRKARVLWLGLTDGSGALQKLFAKLERELETAGFEKEDRAFKPHLTVGRLREPQKSKALVEAHLQKHFEPAGFEVSAIVIYESKLQPTGSVYSVLEKQKLTG